MPTRSFTLPIAIVFGAFVFQAIGLLESNVVLAAEGPRTEEQAPRLRDFTLRNGTDETIAEAHAYTTTGKNIDITEKGALRSRQAQNFVVKSAECIDRVTVKFQDGKTLSSDHLNDCRDPRFVARAEQITVETSAGGPLHPSAASRDNIGARVQ